MIMLVKWFQKALVQILQKYLGKYLMGTLLEVAKHIFWAPQKANFPAYQVAQKASLLVVSSFQGNIESLWDLMFHPAF